MGKGNFFENLWSTIVDGLTEFWGFVVDYWKEFLNNPGKFIENHVFIFLAVVFLLVLIIVLIINGISNISDKKTAKKKALEAFDTLGPKSIEEIVLKMEEEASLKENIFLEEEQEIKTEIPEEIKEVDEIDKEDNGDVVILMEEEKEISEVPLPSVINIEEEKVIPIIDEQPLLNEDIEEEIVEEINENVNSFDDLPQYEFVADVKIVTPREKEGIAKVRIEPEEPITFKAFDEEIVFDKEEKKHSFAFEDEELDLDFDFSYLDRDTKKEPVRFDPIPELRSLEREDVDSFDETLFEDEIKVEDVNESEPIVTSKIEVVKVNPTKKFGSDNTDTNRQGKTFTYDELYKIIKD